MTDALIRLIELGGYPAIAILMCLENVFPPLPSEIIMGLGGIEVGQGNMGFAAVVAAGTLGSTAGNYFWFALGRRFGVAGLGRLVERWGRWLTLDHETIAPMNRFFHRHGPATVFFARMVPTIRTLISLPAGLFGMSRWRFLVWTAAGATVWNVALVWIGYELGSRVTNIDEYTGPISTGIIAVIVVTYAWRVIAWRSGDNSAE